MLCDVSFFVKAVRETPKHVSALVFDNRWQRRLTRDYVKVPQRPSNTLIFFL